MPAPSAPPRKRLDLVLHIGANKTGSSSVQHFLGNNREQLASLGCLYPLIRGTRKHWHIHLTDTAGPRRPWPTMTRKGQHHQRQFDLAAFQEKFRHALISEIDQSGLSRVLLSDESAYHQLDAGALRRLRRLTDEIATGVRLVVYLRRQDDHLVSVYQQNVVNGAEIRRMDEVAQRAMCTPYEYPYDYEARLRMWEHFLEPDVFVVRRFEQDSFTDGSLVRDFLHATNLEVPLEDLDRIPRQNESLDAESVEFKRLLNLYFFESTDPEPGVIDNRTVAARLREASAGPVLTLPGQVLDAFMAQWAGTNRAVAQRYLGDASGELFRMPRRTHHKTTEQYLDPARVDHYLSMLELPETMHEPLRRLAEREAKSH